VAGIIIGAGAGLVLTNNEFANLVLRPFILAANATPRIAVIPIIVIIFGPTLVSTSVVSIVVVFFLVFFNAFEGGRAIPREVIQNVRIFGATDWRVMMDLRLPYVLAWTFAAVAQRHRAWARWRGHGGDPDRERRHRKDADHCHEGGTSNETFAIVIILATIGAGLVMRAAFLRARVLHWWEQGETK